VLRDCGLFQGRRAESRERNSHFAFDPQSVHGLVLSHAHIDHCGNIPSLVRHGYRGPIHATTATVALCDIMLHDAAHIQEQDAAYLNQKHGRENEPPVEPLYTTEDADRAMTLFRGYHYGNDVPVGEGISVRFIEAGHILGAALTVFTLTENGRTVRVGYAFDLGRKNLPLIRDPEYMADIDVMVIESTYGDRMHTDARSATGKLGEIIRRTTKRGGKVIIPSFALERAQEVLFHIAELVAAGEIEQPEVFVDSPMASAVTKVFERSKPYLDEEYAELHAQIGRVMMPSWVRFVGSVEESKALNRRKKPCIVISASGMCEHGRILHHLKHGIEDEATTIVIVGYQAAHTLGRRLVEGETRVRIFGDWYERKAEVDVLNAFSAHADRDDLVDYVTHVRPKKTFLVHGEPDQREALARHLRDRGIPDVHIPHEGDVAEL
jgi:metallo-beta-lactamase family protein